MILDFLMYVVIVAAMAMTVLMIQKGKTTNYWDALMWQLISLMMWMSR